MTVFYMKKQDDGWIQTFPIENVRTILFNSNNDFLIRVKGNEHEEIRIKADDIYSVED